MNEQCDRDNSMTSQPGEAGIPYTHREIFLAAPHAVGQGLDTFGDINNTDLAETDTLADIIDNPDAWQDVVNNDKVFNELLKSKYINQNHETQIAVEYLAKQTPNISTNSHTDVSDLIRYANLSTLTQDDIKYLLGTKLSHSGIWNDTTLYNRLLVNSENWVEFWRPLTSYGNPINKYTEDAISALAKYAVGSFNQSIWDVFQDQNNIRNLLEENNQLNTSAPSIVTNHPSAISNQSIGSNLPSGGNYGINHTWRDSPSSNSIALGLLNGDSMELRRAIAAGRLNISDADFSFTKLMNGNYSKTFVESLATLEDEIIKNVEDHGDWGSIEVTNGNLKITASCEGDTTSSQTRYTPANTDTGVTFRDIDVSQYTTLEIQIDSSTNYTSGSVSESIQVSSDDTQIEWNSPGGVGDIVFDVSDKDRTTISFHVSLSDNYGSHTTSYLYITISDIDIY